MAETISKSHLARIEPDDRLVVLARTIHARDPRTETALKDGAVNWARFGSSDRRSIGTALSFRMLPKRRCGAISN
jgi:hypothetical protein